MKREQLEELVRHVMEKVPLEADFDEWAEHNPNWGNYSRLEMWACGWLTCFGNELADKQIGVRSK